MQVHTQEMVDSEFVYRQLVHISQGGEIEEYEAPKQYNHIDGHPLVAAGNLIGSVIVKLCEGMPDFAHIEAQHKAQLVAKDSAVISVSSILIHRGGGVLFQVRPGAGVDNDILADNLDDLLYAQSSYMPRRLLEKYSRVKGAARVGLFSSLERTSELLDFIHGTCVNPITSQSN